MRCFARPLLLALWLLIATGATTTVHALTSDGVLLVTNAAHPWSQAVIESYRSKRNVPADHLVVLNVPVDGTVAREVYHQQIERPIIEWLRRRGLMDRIACIVLGPGVPLRIAGTPGRTGTSASVDSELATLYRRLTGTPVPALGFVANPYFSAQPLTSPRPFTRAAFDIYLVTRLDGFTQDDARALIERADRRPSAVKVVVDGRPPTAGGAEVRWLDEVSARVRSARPDATVAADATATVIRDESEVTGYSGWGSNDAPGRRPPVAFGAGSIAVSFMSSDARTMQVPPATWQPAGWQQPDKFFAGSPDALAGDWLNAGLTGLGAQVQEPYLDGAFRPAPLFEAWLRGYTLAESFYLALPYLSWQGVVFGDPLARIAEPTFEPVALPEPSDTSSFVQRSAVALRTREPQLDDGAARLIIQAQLSIEAGNHEAAMAALEQATVRAARFAPALLALAQEYERAGRHDLARSRYEAALAVEPRNPLALNNLAYNLAVHAARPAEALAVAERLAQLGSNQPAILDTVGWVRHLAGDSAGARAPLQEATRRGPRLCEGWLHLAIVEQANGAAAEARAAAEQAVACDAALAESAALREIRKQ